MGNIKLFPLVVIATVILLTLKIISIFVSGSTIFTGSAPATAQDAVTKLDGVKPIVPKEESKTPKSPTTETESNPEANSKKAAPQDREVGMGPEMRPTKSEFEVLQSLATRRTVLEEQAREILLRENLINAAEKRVEARIKELKDIEGRIKASLKQQEQIESEKFTRLVKMYSAMKPKRAAAIFDRLNIDVLLGLVQRMKARKMAEILAKMNTAQAERLTMEIANQDKKRQPAGSNLPKIGDGDPS